MAKETEEQGQYDKEGNGSHYTQNRLEVIDMMIAIWGKDTVMKHCEMTAFKYRMRLGHKPGQTSTKELLKAHWYEKKAKELKESIRTEHE